jgi:hypothetical protein
MSAASTQTKAPPAAPKPTFQKYNTSYLKLGMKFTAPVFFDDGVNMFLAENCTVKSYHLQAIKQWSLPVILTYGKLTSDSPRADDDAIPVSDAPPPKPREAASPAASPQTEKAAVSGVASNAADAEELEELEELEDLDDAEELEELEEI